MKKNSLKNLITLAIFIGALSFSFGQPPSGPPPGGAVPSGNTPPCWSPQCVPIDGGLSFLLAAGALLGVRTLRSKK